MGGVFCGELTAALIPSNICSSAVGILSSTYTRVASAGGASSILTHDGHTLHIELCGLSKPWCRAGSAEPLAHIGAHIGSPSIHWTILATNSKVDTQGCYVLCCRTSVLQASREWAPAVLPTVYSAVCGSELCMCVYIALSSVNCIIRPPL